MFEMSMKIKGLRLPHSGRWGLIWLSYLGILPHTVCGDGLVESVSGCIGREDMAWAMGLRVGGLAALEWAVVGR